MNPPPFHGFRSVLLTGATGSLGGHLCAELLDSTAMSLQCLVRANSHAHGRERLDQRLALLDDPPRTTAHRLAAVPGDLTSPHFGLAPCDFDALAESIDVIVHSAAEVNLAADYEDLAPANLGAVRNLIALARRRTQLTGRPPGVHHVSTLGTLIAARATGLDETDEHTAASAATAGPLGYPRTKAVAEAELRAAAAAYDIPVTVYRPGVITGHSRTGNTSASDPLTPLLRAAVALGAAPTGDQWAPGERVDIVARALVRLMHRPDAPGRTFHLVSPEPLPLSALFDALRRAGHHFEQVTPDEWWHRVEEQAHDPAVRPMAAMRDIGRHIVSSGDGHRMPRPHSEATWAALAETGLCPTPWDTAFLDRFAAALDLPAPSARAPLEEVPPRRSATTPMGGASAEPAPFRIDGMLSPIRLGHDGLFPDAAGAASACEAAGYGGFWAREQNHNPLLTLTQAAAHTTLPLGTAAVVALARSPMTLAHCAHDLHVLSGGRLTLGIGSQVAANLTYRFSMPADHRLDRLREFIQALRAIWDYWNNGRPLSFTGTHYTHTFNSPFFTPPPSPYGPPPLYLAATGPRMAELAGELADGLIAPPYAPPLLLTDVLLPALERGLTRSGRTRTDVRVVYPPLLVTGRTPAERARSAERTRRIIALFCGTRAYRPVFELYDLGGLSDTLSRISLTADPERWQRMADLIDDFTLGTFATVADDPARVGSQLRARYGGLIDRAILPAPHGPEADLWNPKLLGLDAADPTLNLRP
ncbi:TIGR03617 family F420-dependent LLM class oxidoreductase [Streptomyces sp. NPDC058049]|uniref:TIGR03617 family F420-dependent LLM class oxidoreductase n=1 Tax=Streptomyces sp. NPDC058049 TaxID=3346314 RepID=UPI0036E93FD3